MYKYIKRLLDFLLSGALFIIISPLFIILIIIVKIKIGSPVFFKQERTGYKEKRFNLIKFRTMTNKKDENGKLLPDSQRLTNTGKLLRSTSLDELPELISIIKGDMSIIGPRPLPSTYDPFYTDKEKSRFNVRGGLIPPGGSIKKNPIITWDDQLEIEANYATHLNIKTDIVIFINAFSIIFKRKQYNYGSYERKPLNIERAAPKRNTSNARRNK